MPKLVDSERSKFRYQLAAGAAILAVVLTFIAVRFQSKDYLISKPAKTSPDRSYTRMWFAADDAFVGVTQKGAHFSIHQWGGDADRGWELDVTHATEELKWTIAPDLSRIAWLAGSTLQSAKMPQQNGAKLDPVSIELPDAPLAFSLLSDGSLAATFADSSVSRWNADTGAPLEEHNLNLKSLEQAMADGDYLAVSPTHANRMVLYRFRDGKEWTIVDDSPAPDPPYQIVLPAPGFMATLSSGRLRVGTTIRNSPGEVRSVVSHLDNMIASGDFENVFVVPDDENPYLLASAVPGSLVAAGEQHLAVSGPQGTTIFNLGTETRLTMGGRAIQWVGDGLGLLAELLAFAPLLLAKLLALINQLIRGKKKKSKDFVPAKLADPPLELLKMCASGEGVLWAGAGLSAQAGVALRTNFIANILQFAQIE